MERMIAPIDEKNVCTDWIDSIFDNANCIMEENSVVGYVNTYPVLATWNNNTIVWKAILGGESCLNELKKRLSEFESPESDIYSERKIVRHLILQSFYFKED